MEQLVIASNKRPHYRKLLLPRIIKVIIKSTLNNHIHRLQVLQKFQLKVLSQDSQCRAITLHELAQELQDQVLYNLNKNRIK